MHRSLALALALVAVAACDHRPEDFTRVQTASRTFQDNWSRRIGQLDKRHAELLGRARALPPDAPDAVALQGQLAALESRLTRLRDQITSVAGDVSARIGSKRRRLAEEALTRGDRELSSELVALTRTLDDYGNAVEAAEQQVPAPPAPPPTAAGGVSDPEFARAVGSVDVLGIEFTPSSAELDLAKPSTAPALDGLVAFARSCDQLRFTITGHTAKDGNAEINQRVSEARAHAVRNHLIAAGVPGERIVEVRGVGGAEPAIMEPEPDSPEEAAMPTPALAEIRARNRRFTVTVVVPCPS
jgi:outer membrane protein OmpA-like peptidoglycan-associated protein